MTIKQQLIAAFHQIQAFQWNPEQGFRLASGLISPYYVDCRILLSHPGPRHLVAHLAFDRLADVSCDLIGGLEIGAIPFATCLSDFGFLANPKREWSTFTVRKQPKDHGLGKTIEGAMLPGARALIVDDVITTGGSLLLAARAARKAGLLVTHALVIVDRSETNGSTLLVQEGIQVLSLLTLNDLKASVHAQEDV